MRYVCCALVVGGDEGVNGVVFSALKQSRIPCGES